MPKFDANLYVVDMYNDDYYPKFLVDKVKVLIEPVVAYLEDGDRDMAKIQDLFDVMTLGINDLEDEFDENDSEIETVARESIGQTVSDIIQCFGLNLDTEEAIREREW